MHQRFAGLPPALARAILRAMTNSAPPPARAALVTGAAKRIGRAIAEDLASQGWAVAVHYNSSRAEAEALVRSIQQNGGRAVALHADLQHEAEVQALLPRATEALGSLSLLVNNASLFEMD